MTPIWAQRREELRSDGLVSPDVFHQMVDRLAEFVVPYQQALEAEAGHPMHLYLQGLLSPLQRKRMPRKSRPGSMWHDRSSKTASVSCQGTIGHGSRC